MRFLTTILIIQIIFTAATFAYDSELFVLNKPSYQKFSEKTASDALKMSDFNDIVLAASGFSIDKSVEWKGLKNLDSFSAPKVTLLFTINDQELKYESLKSPIKIIEDNSVDMGLIREEYEQVNGLAKIIQNIPTDLTAEFKGCDLNNNQFYLFNITSSFGDSDKVERSIDQVVKYVAKNCINDLDKDLLALLLSTTTETTTTTLHRNKRSAVRNERALFTGVNGRILNRAVFYSNQYPVIFNIIFWTSLLLGLAVLGASYITCYMDPGLNTVIYRMTSQRIKKDN